MARTVLEDRSAIVLGIDTAPGRAAAQQLSRANVRVLLASRDEAKLDAQGSHLERKGGRAVLVVLPPDRARFAEVIEKARGTQHLHMVVNALALAHDGTDASRAGAEQDALEADRICHSLLAGRGPLKMVTLWAADREVPPPVAADAWHSYLVLGPHQRLDTERIDELDATGNLHLRAGGVADTIVALYQVPPSVRPTRIHLDCVPSAEKKK